jgi:hypothetical protein
MMWHFLFHLAWEIAFQGRNGKMVQAGAWFGPSSQCIELIASKAKSGSIVYKEE